MFANVSAKISKNGVVERNCERNFKTTPMMNAHRFPKALVLLGLASALAGWTFKLNHLMGAPTLFNCGIGLLTIGLIWWAVLLFRGSE